jgi:hypothetical protein
MQDHFTRLYGANAFEDSRNYDSAGNFAPHKRAVLRDSDAEAQTRRRGYRRGFQALDELRVTHDASDEAARAFEEKRSRLETSGRAVTDGTTDAAAAYDARTARMENAWRERKETTNSAAPVHTHDAAEARALADQAYADRKSRIENAWKQR